MNRVNILTAIDLLEFAKKVNLAMIDGGHALTGKPFSEQEVLDLKGECISADEAIEILEEAIRNDTRAEVAAQNKEAAESLIDKVFV